MSKPNQHSNQRKPLSNLLDLNRFALQQQATPPPPYPPYGMSHPMSQQPPTGQPGYISTRTFSEPDSDDSDSNPRLSTIRLIVKTPLTIKGNGNLVAVDPATNASKITMAVISAFRQISSASGGVPMIDQDGNPRPVDVHVTAGVEVLGTNNVVGEKAVLSKTVVGGALKKIDPEQEGGPTAERSGSKRQRSGSEPVEMDSKKTRVE